VVKLVFSLPFLVKDLVSEVFFDILVYVFHRAYISIFWDV
jgi:hypothetical protein